MEIQAVTPWQSHRHFLLLQFHQSLVQTNRNACNMNGYSSRCDMNGYYSCHIMFIWTFMSQYQRWKVFCLITNTLIVQHVWLVTFSLQLNCPTMFRKLTSAVAFQSNSRTEKTCEDTEPCVDNQIFRITKCYASVAWTERVIKQLSKNNFP